MPGLAPSDVWRTIRQGKLIQVLAVYAGASFVVLEAVGLFIEQLGLPDWVFPGAVILLLLGLPIIMATAFVQGSEAAPPGLPGGEGAGDGAASAPAAARSVDEVAAVAKGWLTWRRALMGGVLAFAVLGVTTAGYMGMRAAGIGPVGSLVAAGVLDAREPIILADFESSSGDAELATITTEAFRIDLAQSSIVSLLPPDERAQAIARMDRAEDAPLYGDEARELAIREGIKAVIAGDIARTGSSFNISVELISAASGELLVAYRETAKDSSAIMTAIDELSKKLRARVGESLRTIRANEPLAEVTTGSLAALLKYSQGMGAIYVEGDLAKGIALLEEAIETDSLFAMAYRELGVTLYDSGERARGVEAIGRAFENRRRLTDRERYHAVGTYYDYVLADLQRASTAYRTLLDGWPDDARALYELASLYAVNRDYARAEQLLRKGAQADSFTALCYPCLAQNQAAQGKFDAAAKTIERLAQNVPDNPSVDGYRAILLQARGENAAAEVKLREWLEADLPLFWRATGQEALASLMASQGRLAESERYFRAALATQDERGQPAAYLESALALAAVAALVLGDGERALERLEEALRRYPLESAPMLDMPYLRLASFYAWVGRTDLARSTIDAYTAGVPAELRGWDERDLHAALGHLATAQGRPLEAIAEARLHDEATGCAICALYGLGRAYDAAGMPDSAIAVYGRYVDSPVIFRVFLDGIFLPGILQRLGELYEDRGDAEKATYYYGKLLELWANADPQLQPRVAAARRAIAALSSDR